jgi:hypothetical protein
MTAAELVGKRALVKLNTATWSGAGGTLEEVRVLEVSPSGNFVRLMTAFGRKVWRPCLEVAVLEELKTLEPSPASTPKQPRPIGQLVDAARALVDAIDIGSPTAIGVAMERLRPMVKP